MSKSTPPTAPLSGLTAVIASLFSPTGLSILIPAHVALIAHYVLEFIRNPEWERLLPIVAYTAILVVLVRKALARRPAAPRRRPVLCRFGLISMLFAFILLVAFYTIEVVMHGQWQCLLPAAAFLLFAAVTATRAVYRTGYTHGRNRRGRRKLGAPRRPDHAA